MGMSGDSWGTLIGLDCPTCQQGQTCQSHFEKKCFDRDPWWYNSCGDRESIVQSCGMVGGGCLNGECVITQTCESHSYKKCDGGKTIYWYDGCDKREEQYEVCSNGCEYGNSVCKTITQIPSCNSHASKRCVGNTIYWYDSCGKKEEEYKYCEKGCRNGECVVAPTCSPHSDKRCDGTDIYWYDSCGKREEIVKYCPNGCKDGECVIVSETAKIITTQKEKVSNPALSNNQQQEQEKIVTKCSWWQIWCKEETVQKQKEVSTSTLAEKNKQQESKPILEQKQNVIQEQEQTQECSWFNQALGKCKKSIKYPIILVHGWGGDLNSLKELQNKLNSEGIAENKGAIYSTSTTSICENGWSTAVSVNFDYYDDGEDKGINSYARKLKTAIDVLSDCTGSSKVTIIAHSMGGLVSRDYMKNYGDGKVNKLIMLETPNYGSPFASLGGITSSDANLMIPGNDFLNSLNLNKNECEYRNKMINIASRVLLEGLVDDKIKEEASKDICPKKSNVMSMIVPVESAKLSGAENIEITGCSHSSESGLIDLTDTSIASPECIKAYNNAKKYIE